MNNDRFKFRVWLIKENCYNHQEPFPTCCMQENGLLAYFREEKQMQNYIVEQCTGLKDKNGNLIYESDYVNANDVIYRVFWNKTKISLVNILNGDMIDMSETITMEIVGNEHEKNNISEIPKNPKRSSD